MKEIVAIDADDVLFDENNAARLFHNARYGTNHTAEDYLVDGQEYGSYWEGIWGVEGDEGYRRYLAFLEHKMVNHLEPISGARTVLEQRSDRYGYVLNTSRPGEALEVTREALRLFYPGLFAEVYCLSEWDTTRKATKAEICLGVGATHLVDDNFEHSAIAAEAGIDAMLYGDFGWNRWQELRPGMTRTPTWEAVGEHLDGRR